MGLSIIALLVFVLFSPFDLDISVFVKADALHPIRYDTEEAFFKTKLHERSMSTKEMVDKIKKMRDRRKHKTWDPSNPTVVKALSHPPIYKNNSLTHRNKRPNILFILADDLGYGDLSVYPFKQDFDPKEFPCIEGGILSPNLERMASNGVTMTNFHSAAPVCSPARAAIMTGLYSYRMNAMNAFELGRDLSQRNGFLPQIPTIAEILREEGYYTIHSGKWHLGGMREEQRLDRVNKDHCNRPSPNQHGFEEYISELDGPESPRYTFLLRNANLHTQGHRHLIADDIPVPILESHPAPQENILSDREAQDALDLITKQHKDHPEQPWFAQIWFNAPHGPWEILKTGEALYSTHYNKTPSYWEGVSCPYQGKDYPLYSQNWYYKTMVTAMDRSIGHILDTITTLYLDRETLIIFTSDNGNEMGAGGAGLFQDGKRSLMEGGVRIPTIIQWTGTIPARSYSSYFAAHTDLLPTLLEVAGVNLEGEGHQRRKLFFDGISILPVLTQALPSPSDLKDLLQSKYHVSHGQVPGDKEIRERLARHWQRYPELLPPALRPPHAANNRTATTSSSRRDRRRRRGRRRLQLNKQQGLKMNVNQQMTNKHRVGMPAAVAAQPAAPDGHSNSNSNNHKGHSLGHTHPTNRIFLWHKDTDPYRAQDQRQQAGGYYENVKILTSGPRHCIDRIFDLAADPFEHHNLLKAPYTTVQNCRLGVAGVDVNMIRSALSHGDLDAGVIASRCHLSASTATATEEADDKDKDKDKGKEVCKVHYINTLTVKIMIIIRKLLPFVRDGKRGHDKYMSESADKATCSVPVASMIEPLDYVADKGCEGHRFGCSFPEY